MNIKNYLILIAILSTLITIYLIYVYGYNWLVFVHWAIVSLPAIYFLRKKK